MRDRKVAGGARQQEEGLPSGMGYHRLPDLQEPHVHHSGERSGARLGGLQLQKQADRIKGGAGFGR